MSTVVAVALSLPGAVQAAQDCGDWKDCRERALAAAASQDYERFHDLAWRAVQKGPRNDPALMTLLARAQSSSGRPHDALVMLRRIAALGVVVEGTDADEFRRVRALPEWAELEARFAELAATATKPPPPADKTADRPAPRKAIAPAPAPPTPATSSAPPTPPPPAASVDPEPVLGDAADALRFTTDAITPAGLVYDAVSHRFIVGDRLERKLSVIGERSQRIFNFIGQESAGFGELGGLAIDAKRGDLWVASNDERAGASLHKLQLISGRLLFTATLAPDTQPARFDDLAVTPDGTVLALDGLGRRLFRLQPGARDFALAASLPDSGPLTMTIGPTSTVYLSDNVGLTRIDLDSEAAQPVKAPRSTSLAGLAWIGWHRGSLIGVQKTGDNTYRIVRIRLNRSGSSATRVDLLERDVSLPGASCLDIVGGVLYYLTSGSRPSSALELVIRRITLR